MSASAVREDVAETGSRVPDSRDALLPTSDTGLGGSAPASGAEAAAADICQQAAPPLCTSSSAAAAVATVVQVQCEAPDCRALLEVRGVLPN